MKDICQQIQQKVPPRWSASKNHSFVKFCKKHFEENNLPLLHCCGKFLSNLIFFLNFKESS